MKERKHFGKVFEEQRPLVELHRMTAEELEESNLPRRGTTVGVFHGLQLLAIVDLDDIFDEEGNRFYND